MTGEKTYDADAGTTLTGKNAQGFIAIRFLSTKS